MVALILGYALRIMGVAHTYFGAQTPTYAEFPQRDHAVTQLSVDSRSL